MAREHSNFRRVAMLCLIFGIVGAHIGGELGAFGACILAIGFGIALWHTHDWKPEVLYDREGKPTVMVKFCECGELEFVEKFQAERVKKRRG